MASGCRGASAVAPLQTAPPLRRRDGARHVLALPYARRLDGVDLQLHKRDRWEEVPYRRPIRDVL